MKHSAILFLSFALAFATALPTEDDVVPQDFAEDLSTHEISLQDSFLQAQNMQVKKGDNACEQIAKDLKQVVATNVKALQTAQDAMDKGLSCKDTGQSGVKSAQKTLATAQTAKTKAQNAHNAASTAKVDFGEKKLNKLDSKKCDFFQMPSYTAAVKKREDAKKQFETAKGEVVSAETGLKNAEDAAKIAVLKCKCDTVTSHKTALGKRNADAASANKEGWTKAEHLICVLQGKDMNACTVSSIPKVEAAKGLCKGCDSDACATYKQSITLPKGSLPDATTIDSCGGFRVIPSQCSGGNVAYAVSKSNTWDKKQLYACPAGWHWMKSASYYAYLKSYGCFANNNKAQTASTAYSNSCGWSGNYKPPGGAKYYAKYRSSPRSHQAFRFADSAITNTYQHAGNYPGYKTVGSSKAYFAGIVCKKN